MNRTMPPIHESAADLKQRRQQERDPRKRQRLHALYLLTSGQARRRHQVATLLGLDRNTIGRWLSLYAQGGLPALLDIYVPAGKAPALTPAQLDHLQQRLAQPAGFASYGEIQQWIATTLGVQLGYHAVHTLVHDKLRARPNVARPSHEKKYRGGDGVSRHLR
jgi:putative transposase